MVSYWTSINRIKNPSESNHFPVLISHPQANKQTTDKTQKKKRYGVLIILIPTIEIKINMCGYVFPISSNCGGLLPYGNLSYQILTLRGSSDLQKNESKILFVVHFQCEGYRQIYDLLVLKGYDSSNKLVTSRN